MKSWFIATKVLVGKKANIILFLNGIPIFLITDSPRKRKGETWATSEHHCTQRAEFLLFGNWFVPQAFKCRVFSMHFFYITVMNWPHFYSGDCYSTAVEWYYWSHVCCLCHCVILFLPRNSQGNAFTNKQLNAWNAVGNLFKFKQKKICMFSEKKFHEKKPLWGSLDMYRDIALVTLWRLEPKLQRRLRDARLAK